MEKTFHILMLEDNPADAELIQFELSEAGIPFIAKLVASEEAFIHQLQTACPDIILSDYDLPCYTGALALAEARRVCPDTPFILVTGAVSEERAIEILTSGAKDYVMKNRLARLAPAVRRVLAEADEHRARKQAEEELLEAHRHLERQVAERTAELQRKNERLALLSQVTSRLLANDNPQQLVEELCGSVMQFLDCHAFFNFLVDEERGCLHLNAFAGIPKEKGREIEWLDFGVAVCGCAARDGCRIVAEHIPSTPDIRTDLVKSFGIKAYACHPLLDQERVIGTLSFGTRSRETFDADDLAMMKAVADQVAIAMHRLRQEQALRQAHGELEETVRQRTAELSETIAQLEGEKRRFIEVLDILPAYVILLTRDHQVAFENRFFRERFGDAQGRPCFEFLFGLKSPCENCETYKVLERMEPYQWEWTGPDGRQYQIYDFPFHDVNGTTLILEMGLDVTEQKETAQELARYRQHLEELVGLRTSQLEEANRELESFSYSVSHDLRAPLRAIDGFSRMIFEKQGEHFAPETKRLFTQIRETTGTMTRLIDDLLSLSRLGGQAMTIEPVDMQRLVEETWQELQAGSPARQVVMKMAELPCGLGDKVLLKQVFVNLLSNAIKFTREKETGVIEAGGDAGESDTVYYIRDNGVGFDMKYVDKLFNVFQRLHDGSDYEGSGIGLAIVQRLILRHGGRVWAEGAVEGGATFYFALPTRVSGAGSGPA